MKHKKEKKDNMDDNAKIPSSVYFLSSNVFSVQIYGSGGVVTKVTKV